MNACEGKSPPLPPPVGASNPQPVLHHAGVVSAQTWWTVEHLFGARMPAPPFTASCVSLLCVIDIGSTVSRERDTQTRRPGIQTHAGLVTRRGLCTQTGISLSVSRSLARSLSSRSRESAGCEAIMPFIYQ